ASYISGFEGWYDNLCCPVNCVRQMKKGGEPLRWTIVSFVLVLHNYPASIILIIPATKRQWLRGRKWIIKFHNNFLGRFQNKLFLQCFYRAIAFLVKWFWFTYASELEDVLELTAWFSLGVYWVITERDMGRTCRFPSGQLCMEPSEWDAQNKLTFGQLVPLF